MYFRVLEPYTLQRTCAQASGRNLSWEVGVAVSSDSSSSLRSTTARAASAALSRARSFSALGEQKTEEVTEAFGQGPGEVGAHVRGDCMCGVVSPETLTKLNLNKPIESMRAKSSFVRMLFHRGCVCLL